MNLDTSYMGLKLKSPIVVAACSLSEKIGDMMKMEDAGAGAIVLFSLFEEQIKEEREAFQEVMDTTNNLFYEAQNYFPTPKDYAVGADSYLQLIREAKERLDIPIIGSLNGISNEGWIDFAKDLQEAGADAIELNVYFIPADFHLTSNQVEEKYLDILLKVKDNVNVPVAVKLNPYFSAIGNMCKLLEDAGANGLVVFNRFYQPDFDIEKLKVIPSLKFSSAVEIRLPLLWISLLYGNVNTSLAATTGVQTEKEIIKYLLAGADVVMIASALYKHGIRYIQILEEGLRHWMEDFGFDRVSDFRGIMSQIKVADPTAFERANYIKILERYGR